MEWRDIPGYEGLYQVSSFGLIRGLARRDIRGSLIRGRILKAAVVNKGYLKVGLSKNGKSRTFFVHKLVLLAFIGPRPDGMIVCHNDGNPANNSVGNIRYDTPHANNMDVIRHGNNWWLNKTKCPAGHPYTEENTYVWERLSPSGYVRPYRVCKTCWRARNRKRYNAELTS